MFEKESEAWQALANRLQENGRMTAAEFVPNGAGLCLEVGRMYERAEIARPMLVDMEHRIHSHMYLFNRKHDGEERANASAWLAPEGRVEPRIIAAQLLALESAGEESIVSLGLRGFNDAEFVGFEVDPDQSSDDDDDEDDDDDDELSKAFYASEAAEFERADDDEDEFDDAIDAWDFEDDSLWDSVDEIVDEDEDLPW